MSEAKNKLHRRRIHFIRRRKAIYKDYPEEILPNSGEIIKNASVKDALGCASAELGTNFRITKNGRNYLRRIIGGDLIELLNATGIVVENKKRRIARGSDIKAVIKIKNSTLDDNNLKINNTMNQINMENIDKFAYDRSHRANISLKPTPQEYDSKIEEIDKILTEVKNKKMGAVKKSRYENLAKALKGKNVNADLANLDSVSTIGAMASKNRSKKRARKKKPKN